jgi:hypothetical protein
MPNQLRHCVFKHANVAIVKGDAHEAVHIASTHCGDKGGHTDTTKPVLSQPGHLLGEPSGSNAKLIRIPGNLLDTVVHEYHWYVFQPEPAEVSLAQGLALSGFHYCLTTRIVRGAPSDTSNSERTTRGCAVRGRPVRGSTLGFNPSISGSNNFAVPKFL